MLAISTACSSGGDDPGTGKGGSSSTGTSGTSNNTTAGTGNSTAGTGNNTGGTGNSTAGTGNSTAGTGNSTAGTGTGGSGTGGTGNPGAPSVCDEDHSGTIALDLMQAYVDNFETTTRWDGWYSYAAVPTGMTADKLAHDATGYMSATAAQITNTGINTGTDKFGSGVGFNMRSAPPTKACADVSAFDGVSFWAKGTSGAAGTVQFLAVVASQQKEPDGDCTAAMETAGNCYKHPSKSFVLTSEWKQYTIKWSEVEPQALFANRVLLALQWISTGPDFDFTIDEVSLYKGTAPTGPVFPPTEGGTGGTGTGGTGGTAGGSGGTGGT